MMSEQTIAIHVTQPIYQRLQRFSKLTHRPLESLVLQTLDANLPALPENLSEAMRRDLVDLESLDDEDLWQVARGVIDREHQAQYSLLLEKRRQGTITATEETTLETLYQAANRYMLRKAYAYMLLKWRGYQLPTLEELEAQP
jgi:hypothetical protein